MAVREDGVRDVRHETAPHGRHGRPRPFGGRLRLPTLRFSGAAMAMSTVVGISIATTLLLHEQQGIGRRAGVARVGSTPPPTPSGSGTEQAEASAEHPAAPGPGGRPSASRPARPHPGSSTPAPATPRPGAPEPSGTASAGGHTGLASTDDPSAQDRGAAAAHEPAAPSGPASPRSPLSPQSPQSSPSPQPTGTQPPAQQSGQPSPSPSAGLPSGAPSFTPRLPTVPSVVPAVPGSDVTPSPPATDGVPGTSATAETAGAEQPLSGVAQVTALGRDGRRHVLALSVAEPVTALQAEFRLAPGELAPGSGTAWTNLPGAVVTAQQERGTLVYRFTTPAGTDVAPGHYTFGVRGTRPAGPAPCKGDATENWNAAAFGITDPRAVAALGTFAEAAPQADRQAAPPEARPKSPPVHH
ncbi:hypothetical protein PUR71_20390 [Streptomyces sp. SP17BM10]|uniref:hypothetical protein n=1 Tax=Streptomyces sp. SP17BM10 TaxID=3002530 RepID=UPI002E79A4E3|nr:hypothetical protein [Streptomyces sp. SP17BM10]MEE1785251.1 hypothetical protein [Streptomyces sp. SP17BM10]